MNTQERKRMIREIYQNTFRDYRGRSERGTGIMVMGDNGGVTIIYLERLNNDDLKAFHSERV